MGDQLWRKRSRVRVFKSVQDQEVHKINLKLQARYELCSGVCCRH